MPKRTPEVIDEICRRISEGETLRAICRDTHMPSWRVVYDWLDEDEEFSARIARARDLGFDAIAQEAMSIADTPVIGEETEDDGDRVKVKRGDMLGHRRLQVETRLKLLSKWCPKRYGERSAMQVTGSDGGALVIQVVTGVPTDG